MLFESVRAVIFRKPAIRPCPTLLPYSLRGVLFPITGWSQATRPDNRACRMHDACCKGGEGAMHCIASASHLVPQSQSTGIPETYQHHVKGPPPIHVSPPQNAPTDLRILLHCLDLSGQHETQCPSVGDKHRGQGTSSCPEIAMSEMRSRPHDQPCARAAFVTFPIRITLSIGEIITALVRGNPSSLCLPDRVRAFPFIQVTPTHQEQINIRDARNSLASLG